MLRVSLEFSPYSRSSGPFETPPPRSPHPRLHKHPLTSSSDAENQWNILPKILTSLPKDLYIPSPSGSPLHDLEDSQFISAKDTTLRVVHTPGHTYDSICLHIPEERTLYTADAVLGQGTAVFEDLSVYLSSLNKIPELGSTLDYVSLIPSHGPVVTNGQATISMSIEHRLEREDQVLQLLSMRTPPGGVKHWTTWSIVKDLYAAYPENIWVPAAFSCISLSWKGKGR